MNKKIIFSLLLCSLLFGCNKETISSSKSTISESENSISNETSFQTSSQDLNSFISSKVTTESISSSINNNLDEANDILLKAIIADEDFSEVRISEYHNYQDYRQIRATRISSYLDATIYVGTTENKNMNNESIASSNFREERTYENNIYTQIRKFDSTFMASSYRKEMEPIEALLNLNAGQGYNAYIVLNSFVLNYNGSFKMEYLESTTHFTFIYHGDVDEEEFQFLVGLELTVDEKNHVTDFWYSEGYYETLWDNYDTPTSMRKHGVYGLGYSYNMDSYKISELTNYPLELQYKSEDNFISEVSFKEEELTYSISQAQEDEYGYKSIYLLDLLLTNPQIGDLVKGCPINNLSFKSSNENVIAINDSWYADFVGEGEAIITVYDAAYQIEGKNTLKITLTK